MPLLVLEGLFVLFWSSGFIGAELGLPYAGPLTFLFWRYFALSVLLLGYLSLRRQLRHFGLGSWRAVGSSALVGVLAHGVWLSAIYWALELGVSAGLTALVTALQPVLVGLLAPWYLAEPSSVKRLTGLGLGFLGVALVVATNITLVSDAPRYAYVLPLISALSATAALLYQRRLEVTADVPILPNLSVQCLATAIVTLPLASVFEDLSVTWTLEFTVALLWMIVVATLLSYGLLWTLLKRSSSVRVSSLIYYTPPTTMLLAYVIFGDALTYWGLAGLGMAALGVWLAKDEAVKGTSENCLTP